MSKSLQNTSSGSRLTSSHNNEDEVLWWLSNDCFKATTLRRHMHKIFNRKSVIVAPTAIRQYISVSDKEKCLPLSILTLNQSALGMYSTHKVKSYTRAN